MTYSAGALTGSGLGVGGSANAVVPNFDIYPYVDGAIDYDAGNFFGNVNSGGGLTPWDGTNRYNYAPITTFCVRLTQWNVGAFVDYKSMITFTPYLEVMVSSAQTRAQIAESGTFFVEAYILGLEDLPEAFAADSGQRNTRLRYVRCLRG